LPAIPDGNIYRGDSGRKKPTNTNGREH
jgi:hypothetical protein